MIMDEEVTQLVNEVFKAWENNNPKAHIREYRYSLSGRVEDKLSFLANELARVRRELDVQKAHSEIWKQQYLELVKENVKLQAFILKEKK
jgi:hypothetical protein